jgi:DNA-binding MarR family transcriptional regulator
MTALVHSRGLSTLADEANREHALVIQAGESMVVHAIKAGEALLAAKREVGHGGWYDWLEQNFTDRNVSTPQLYMRLARNKELILDRGVTGVKEAARLIRGAPDTRVDPAVRDRARDLKRHHGMTNRQIAEALGVPQGTVQRWVNPEAERRYRRNRARLTQAGRRAAQQRERELAVNAKGGSVAEGYALVRRALQTLDSALDAEENREVRQAISTAINRLHIAEDEIVRAVRLA